jgi:serine/threonine protein phosphatase 1
MLTFAIGDIHGMHVKMMGALGVIEWASPDPCRIVFLGDYIDRGPESCEVIEALMNGPQRRGDEWVCLKGNHEEMMLESQIDAGAMGFWLSNGGSQTLRAYGGSLPSQVLDWCASLPVKFETRHHLYVHAGVDPNRTLADQDDRSILWIRGKFLTHQGDFGKHVVHGHTPVEIPTLLPNRNNLDTGAVFGGQLSVGMFDDDRPGSPLRVFSV